MPTLSGSGNKTTRVAFSGRPAPPTQEDKVESFCVCCACERCMDFWLSTSLKCFSTCEGKAKTINKTLLIDKNFYSLTWLSYGLQIEHRDTKLTETRQIWPCFSLEKPKIGITTKLSHNWSETKQVTGSETLNNHFPNIKSLMTNYCYSPPNTCLSLSSPHWDHS